MSKKPPPSKPSSPIRLRTLLAGMQRYRLVGIAVILEIDVPERASKREILRALFGSPHTSPRLILDALTPDEILAVCRSAGIDEADGEPRPELVERLLCHVVDEAAEDADPALDAAPPRKGAGGEPPPGPPAPRALVYQYDPGHQLTLTGLESHLWEAANILRGKIDSSDFKHYIFGLLFYKRLCDVWEEEDEERLREPRDGVREEHRFHIPEEFLWRNVRRHRSDIGSHLNRAFRAIEDANARLAGVFQDVDFENRERFPDATLEMLLQHFERHRLRKTDVEPDMLGNAYEYLISQFADDAGKKGGEFYTPKQVVRLIVECLDPQPGMSIYDPACGSGGMLLEAVHHVGRYVPLPVGGETRSANFLQLYGQEMNLNTWAICQMNLFLHDIDDATVLRGDTLRDPRHLTEDGRLRTFDRVLANPPFSLKNWGHERWRDGDEHGRDVYGCPPPSYGDLAFVQHMLASLEPDGMLGVVLPHGVLFRGAAEGRIRQGLVEDDLVEAIIGLAPNLFYGTGIPACVMVINRAKSAERRGKVLFVDGSREMQVGNNQNRLSEANVERLAQAFHAFAVEDGFSRVVTVEEIAENEYHLNISRYVTSSGAGAHEAVDVPTEMRRLEVLQERRNTSEAKIMTLLAELGYGP